jgi:uncharacterized protein (TIGR00297 family)
VHLHVAESATAALAVTAGAAVLAWATRALTWDGAAAGAIVGIATSAALGLPGLAVLGTFFVLGSAATRIGWERKRAKGTAEAGGGARDARRVAGKGAIAAFAALHTLAGGPAEAAFAGAVAAALADTLGTEIGTLSQARPRSLPDLRPVPAGTPGAVTFLGTFAALLGSFLVVVVAQAGGIVTSARLATWVLLAGFGAAMLESVAVGLGLRAPGFVRNLGTTLAGAGIAQAAFTWLP